MDLIEQNTHSFIIRVWCERVGRRNEQRVWRGHITHVPDGRRRYLRRRRDVLDFIAGYVDPPADRRAAMARLLAWLRTIGLQ